LLAENPMPGARFKAAELEQISAGTLQHYEQHAAQFRAATRDHDVSQNIGALLKHIEGAAPYTILDFGCGPGRDLRSFTDLGHRAIGLEGAAAFAAMARADSGCEVWQQDFLDLKLPAAYFDGVFANASLFHVPGQELPRVLRQLRDTLKPRGVLFSSNPRGQNEEQWSSGRFGAYHDLPGWRAFLSEAGFLELEHYYRPTGLVRAEQPWLATVWRRPA
jgi:SAM-dependent methyltransferase